MGKSPAKWIKSVLLGKKTPKSKVPKGNEKAANDAEVLVVAKSAEKARGLETMASHLSAADDIEDNLELENIEEESPPHEKAVPESELKESLPLAAMNSPERRQLDQAATKVQASFRGYLARHAFRALKGIIRLQALIRGHLVRRQAVSTIHCMLGIIKLQAHVRGQRVRVSDIGLKVQGKVLLENIWEHKPASTEAGISVHANNLSVTSYGFKFLALSPKPLHIQYEPVDPNSVMSWLDRWSASHFWKPAPAARKPNCLTPVEKNRNAKIETIRSKCTNKAPATRVDNGSARSSSEVERSRRTFRKVSTHCVEVTDPESPCSELEKVKRSLRKVHESAFPPVTEDCKSKQTPDDKNLSVNSGKNSIEDKIVADEKKTEDLNEKLPALNDVETSPEQLQANEVNEASEEVPAIQTNSDSKPLENNVEYESIPVENGDPCMKQDMIDNENQKPSVKGPSPAKQEPVQNGSNHKPKLPSYMQATKSAKAKLKDGSLAFEHDVAEKTPPTRRHSLPSSTGAKVSSSPRTQKLTPSNSKPKNPTDKPLSASKYGKADWKR